MTAGPAMDCSISPFASNGKCQSALWPRDSLARHLVFVITAAGQHHGSYSDVFRGGMEEQPRIMPELRECYRLVV
jgi:hypothetical protein